MAEKLVATKDRTSSSFRLLVVEDDPRLQTLYKKVLDVFGFKYVVIVGDGQAAIDAMEETALPFDMVILDWQLPGEKDGMDVLFYIRRHSRRPYTPVLLCTGMAQLRHVRESRDAGMTDFLAKPFTVEQLKEKVVRVFTTQRSFVRTDFYAGPCRRLKHIGTPNGIERRKGKW